MKHNITFFIALFFAINVVETTHAQKIDMTPLDAYWKMIEPLKKGDTLSKKTWNEFLNIEANKVYVDNQGFDDAYLERVRKNLEYVYMPKYDSLLKARLVAIGKDSTQYWNTYKVYVYKANEVALKQYQKQLIEPDYMDTIYKNVWEWLPKHLQQKDTSVVMYFLGIENDAIAGSGVVIETLWSSYNQDKLKFGTLGAHEMHHVLRRSKKFKNVTDNDKGVLYALMSIQNEGVADMIDKKYSFIYENKVSFGFNRSEFLLYQSDSIVKQINNNLVEMEQYKGLKFKTEKEYRDLVKWSSGHNPGYYMTDIIVRNGYKKQLLKTIQNPFEFIYLYNKAAKKDSKKPAIFSDTALAYVKTLEKKYWTEK